MGNKGDLWKHLTEKCPNAFKKITDVFAEKKEIKVAVDLPIVMHRYAYALKSNGQSLHHEILKMAKQMKSQKLLPIFVEDGNFLKHKEHEAKRRKLNEKIWVKTETVIKEENFVKSSNVEILKEEMNSNQNEDMKIENVKIEDVNNEDLKTIRFKPNKSDYEEVIKLLRENDFEVKTAKYEAEALCSYLCLQKEVDVVMTEDSDALTYLCPYILRHYKKNHEQLVVLDEILKSLELTKQQFQDLCIMLGNDYNMHFPNHGFKFCYEAIKKNETLENYLKDMEKITVDMRESKKLFQSICFEKDN